MYSLSWQGGWPDRCRLREQSIGDEAVQAPAHRHVDPESHQALCQPGSVHTSCPEAGQPCKAAQSGAAAAGVKAGSAARVSAGTCSSAPANTCRHQLINLLAVQGLPAVLLMPLSVVTASDCCRECRTCGSQTAGLMPELGVEHPGGCRRRVASALLAAHRAQLRWHPSLPARTCPCPSVMGVVQRQLC